jgi:hypothetical protein
MFTVYQNLSYHGDCWVYSGSYATREAAREAASAMGRETAINGPDDAVERDAYD